MNEIATDEHLAAAFYDHETSISKAVADAEVAAQPEPAAEAAPPVGYDFGKEQKAADAVEINLPPEIQTLRDGESKMYDSRSAYATAITADDLIDSQALDAPPEVKLAVLSELQRMANDVGLAPVEMREVVDISKRLQAEPPTAEVETQWIAEASKRVLDLAGGDLENAQRDVDLARALVARDPRLAKILDASRLGSHPRVIELCIQQARSEFARGRLTLKP